LDLLHELVELAQTGSDEVALEVGRCLGAIGIIDIGLVTPRGRPANPELESAVSTMRDSAKMQQYCHMFHALGDYLTDSELVIALLHIYRSVLCRLVGLISSWERQWLGGMPYQYELSQLSISHLL